MMMMLMMMMAAMFNAKSHPKSSPLALSVLVLIVRRRLSIELLLAGNHNGSQIIVLQDLGWNRVLARVDFDMPGSVLWVHDPQ